ncbi:MAG: hypothetical protein WC044_06740 [Crocinitomicaceae bacterium]
MKLFNILLSVSVLIFTGFTGLAQKPFVGEIKFKVSMIDTNVQQLIDDREMFVYTNDTLSRMEIMNDALGPQVSIKHMVLKKSYLLMNFMGTKLAIQTDQNKDSSKSEAFEIHYKFWGRKKINGFVLKKATIYRDDLKETRTIWYFKSIRPDILDVYPGIKGLPADYYIGTVDGIIHYSLLSIEAKPMEKELFGIPSDFKRITLSEFMEHVRNIEK